LREDAREMNNHIEASIVKLNRIHSRMIEDGDIITAEKIKEIFAGNTVQRKTLVEVFRYHNEMMKSRVGIDFSQSTMTRYNTTLDHIQNFLQHTYHKQDIFLHQIQYGLITDLEHYLKVQRQCNHNSTLKYIRNFRKIINLAVRND